MDDIYHDRYLITNKDHQFAQVHEGARKDKDRAFMVL